MPCYNVAGTLNRAIDSILMQKGFTDYEIIVVDDASTDNTVDIALSYQKAGAPLVIIKNQSNLGNAHSFYSGLCKASGDYFCVLDGDDYYTVNDKFKKQVAFLDSDTQGEYVAVATHFVIDFEDGNVHIPARSRISEFNYSDLLARRSGYFHTSTYMYRNIFRDNVLELFDMKLYRGDSPRTIFHLMFSGKKVRILDFVGSAYSYTFNGIWSSQNEKSHFQYQIDFYEQHRKAVNTKLEMAWIDSLVDYNTRQMNQVDEKKQHHYPACSIEQALLGAKKLSQKFAFSQSDYTFRELFASEYIDTLCASLGFVSRIHDHSLKQSCCSNKSVAIIVSALNPRKGGIFAEIRDLIRMHWDKQVYLFKTDPGGISEEAYEALSDLNNVVLITYPELCEAPYTWLAKRLAAIGPYRAYYYCSHADTYAQAMMDESATENVCLFSFDHGFITGVYNPNITCLAAKRPVDYWLLSKYFKDTMAYIPAWSHGADIQSGQTYQPFRNHDAITTASGAARFYKIDGLIPCSYFDLIYEKLSKLGGKHYHFGPIPDDVLDAFQERLTIGGINPSQFIHIEWSENIPNDLIEYGVDLFIEPFPTVSYKLTLDVLSCGIPVIAYRGYKRMSVTDFIPSSFPTWRTIDEFIRIVGALDESELMTLSREGIDYYTRMHAYEPVSDAIRRLKSYPEPNAPFYVDDALQRIQDHLFVFKLNEISIMAYAT